MKQILFIIFSILFSCISAFGIPVNYDVSGSIADIKESSTSRIRVGDKISGNFSWESEVSATQGPISSNPFDGTTYQQTPMGMLSIKINEFDFTSQLEGIAVSNGTVDKIQFVTEAPWAHSVTDDKNYFTDIVWISFIDTSGTMLDDEGIPTSLELSSFDRVVFGIQEFYDLESESFEGFWNLEANIDKVGYSPVPEPGTLLMLSSGVLYYIGRRKRNMSTTKN